MDAVPGPSSDLPLPCANLLLLPPNRLDVDPQKRGKSESRDCRGPPRDRAEAGAVRGAVFSPFRKKSKSRSVRLSFCLCRASPGPPLAVV